MKIIGPTTCIRKESASFGGIILALPKNCPGVEKLLKCTTWEAKRVFVAGFRSWEECIGPGSVQEAGDL